MRKRIRQAAFCKGIEPFRAWTVVFDPDSPSPVGERAHLACGMVAEVAVGDAKVRNDFDGVSIFQRPIFNATWNEEKRRWVDFVERGEEGFTLSPTEANREVIYRCTPFWYRMELSDTGALCLVSVTDRPLQGYSLAPIFRDGKTPVYRPAFETVLGPDDQKLHSRAGLLPYVSSLSSLQYKLASHPSRVHCERGADWFCDYLLLLVEFATCDLQSVMHGYCLNGVPLVDVSMENGDYPQGLYCSEEPMLEQGEKITVYGRDITTDVFKKAGVYTVAEVIPEEGAGYRIVCENLDLPKLFSTTYEWKFTYERKKTGMAISAVTNASSGRASNDSMAPIVWRGKENPWGNVSSVLWDFVMRVDADKKWQLCHTEGGYNLILGSGLGQVPIGDAISSFSGEESFIKGMTVINNGDFMCPVSFDDTAADRYYASRISKNYSDSDRSIWCVIGVGGNCTAEAGTNYTAMEIFGQKQANETNNLGSRLIFEEEYDEAIPD